jgi:hypothetical protein
MMINMSNELNEDLKKVLKEDLQKGAQR